MPNFANLSITIRSSTLFSSTIIGYARVQIDNEILLKEIPIFHSQGNLSVLISADQVAICPYELDMAMLNHEVWKRREMIEKAIYDKMHGKLRIVNSMDN